MSHFNFEFILRAVILVTLEFRIICPEAEQNFLAPKLNHES